MMASSPFDRSPEHGIGRPWVLGSAGFHGPPHLIDYVEGELEAGLAAADEGLPSDDRPNPLVSALLLVEVVRGLVGALRARRDTRQGELRSPFVERSPLF